MPLQETVAEGGQKDAGPRVRGEHRLFRLEGQGQLLLGGHEGAQVLPELELQSEPVVGVQWYGQPKGHAEHALFGKVPGADRGSGKMGCTVLLRPCSTMAEPLVVRPTNNPACSTVRFICRKAAIRSNSMVDRWETNQTW